MVEQIKRFGDNEKHKSNHYKSPTFLNNVDRFWLN